MASSNTGTYRKQDVKIISTRLMSFLEIKIDAGMLKQFFQPKSSHFKLEQKDAYRQTQQLQTPANPASTDRYSRNFNY